MNQCWNKDHLIWINFQTELNKNEHNLEGLVLPYKKVKLVAWGSMLLVIVKTLISQEWS